MVFQLLLFPTLPQWLLLMAGGFVNEIVPYYLISPVFPYIFTILHSFIFIMLMPILLFYIASVFRAKPKTLPMLTKKWLES